MERRSKTKDSNSSEWYDATLIDIKPTRLSGLVFGWLCAILVLSTAAYGSVDSWASGLLAIGACIIVLLWLADSFIGQRLQFNTSLIQLPILGMILIGLIQMLPLRSTGVPPGLLSIPVTNSITLDPNTTWFAILNYSVYFIFFAAVLTFVNDQRRLRKMVVFVVVFGSIMAFFGIVQHLSGTDAVYGLRPGSYGKPFGSYLNRHHFAGFMEMTGGLTLSLLYGESTKRDKRLLIIIAIVLMGTAVVLTGSRGGFLSFFGVVAFVTLVNILAKGVRKDVEDDGRAVSKLSRNFALIGGSLVLILVLLGSALFLQGDGSLNRGVGLSNQSDVSNGRSHYWQTALLIIRDNPVIGVGLDSFGFAFTKYDTDNGTWRLEQVHNDYLQTLTDAGILGFACLVMFVVLLFKYGLRMIGETSDKFRRGTAVGALAGCFGILIHSFFDFPLRVPSNALFFLTLAALATTSISYPKLYKKSLRD